MKTPRLLLGILVGCLLSSFALAATGPVPASSLPGGAVVSDNDDGSGETWGRPGGRTYSYSGFVLGNFTLLEWQSLSAAMSFDGPVDTAAEVMTLISQGSTELLYTGSTTVQLTAGLTPVDTRFTVNLSGATFVVGTPTVDVLANSSFSVTVLFEARNPITGVWGPALDVFDNLDTPPPPAEMLANTTFEQGFFFDETTALSLSEHDSNMQARANEIVGKLDFLTTEEAGHFAQLVSEHANLVVLLESLSGQDDNELLLIAIQGLVAENNQKLMDILASVNTLPDIGEEIRSAKSELTALIACLWIGILCPDEVPEHAPTLGEITAELAEVLDGIDWAKEDIGKIMEDLEAIIEHQKSNVVPATIELEVVDSNKASSKSEVFLVLSKVHGVPTTANLSVAAVPFSNPSGFSLVPVGAASVEVAPGVQQLTVEVPGQLNRTQAFLINAERILPDDEVQRGSTLISIHGRDD